MNDKLQEALIKQLSKYNKKELYQWLVISMIHPSNQIFGIRYELLIHTLLSIDEDKFLNKELTKEKFEEFISWFEKEYSSHFAMMEDFEPFSQIKLIPLLLDGEKYYFFYGSLERPYESLKQFHDILFSVEITELESIKYEFLFSLQRQTDILTQLVNDKEFEYKTTDMYIPSLKFFNKYKSFFEIENIDENYIHNSYKLPSLTEVEKMFDLGIDKEIDTVDIPQLDIDNIDFYFYQMGMSNFNGLYTKIENKYFYLPFETHIETFYTIAESIIYNNQFQSLNILKESMRQRMMKMLSYFFSPPYRLDGLMDKSKNIHSKYFDTLVQIDKNKVILFKFIPHSNDLHNSITNITEKVFNELKIMKSIDELFAFKYSDENMVHMNPMPISMFETKVIIVFEKLTINYMLHFEKEWKEENIFVYNSLDIKPIFELFSEKKSDINIILWQYLEAEKRQSLHNNNPVQMDTLDSFTNYYENETFAIMGQQPDLLMFAIHSWSDFYHEYLYKKYQDNIYELVESSFPNKFNHIRHRGNEIYEYIDSSTLNGGRCIKYNNKLIWIVYSYNGFSLKEEEMRVSIFIAEFFSFYIDRYKESIFRFLKVFNFDINTQGFMIVVFPDTVVKQNENMEHLLLYANRINDNEPIIFNSYIRKLIYNEIFVGVFCSSSIEKLESIFGYKDNFNPEKYIFEKFITSLLQALSIQYPKELVPKFIENIWDLDERVIQLKSVPVDNYKLEDYPKPLTFQPSFIANVNQEIVNYLKEVQIEPKEYWGDDAKQLNNLIFNFLQKKLEEILKQFNTFIVIYVYKQIEYIEGKREKDKIQMEFDAQKYIEFDLNEQHNKERLEASELAVSAKHILHTILKVNPTGHQNIVDSDWYYLMGFSRIINETIQRSDQLHYNLSDMGIDITHSYELIDIDKSTVVDFNKHYKQVTDSQIYLAKNIVEDKDLKNNSSTVSSPFDKELNIAWKKEYKFYLEDMIKIMMALGKYSSSNDLYSPLSSLTIEEIDTCLNGIFKETISLEVIDKVLKFLSLDFTTYKNYKYIDYSIDKLMNKKERLNLSPFIKIENKYFFGHQLLLNVVDSWIYSLTKGDIPFTIDQDSLVQKELDRIHDKLSKDLENLAYEKAVISVGEIYSRKNIDKFQTLSKKFPQKPPCGEIDLLAINPKIKIIFVMDAKYVYKKFSVSSINRELNKFIKGKKSYLIKLNKKVDFIKENQDEILNHFGISDKDGWKIKKGFVVNTLYVSAFYEEKVDFILVDDLEGYINDV